MGDQRGHRHLSVIFSLLLSISNLISNSYNTFTEKFKMDVHFLHSGNRDIYNDLRSLMELNSALPCLKHHFLSVILIKSPPLYLSFLFLSSSVAALTKYKMNSNVFILICLIQKANLLVSTQNLLAHVLTFILHFSSCVQT